MSNLSNLVMDLVGLILNVLSFKIKNVVFKFDYHRRNTFKPVQYSKNDVGVCLMFDNMIFEPSLTATQIEDWNIPAHETTNCIETIIMT